MDIRLYNPCWPLDRRHWCGIIKVFKRLLPSGASNDFIFTYWRGVRIRGRLILIACYIVVIYYSYCLNAADLLGTLLASHHHYAGDTGCLNIAVVASSMPLQELPFPYKLRREWLCCLWGRQVSSLIFQDMRLNSGVSLKSQHVQLLSNTVTVGLFDSLEDGLKLKGYQNYGLFIGLNKAGICCLLDKPAGALAAVETRWWAL